MSRLTRGRAKAFILFRSLDSLFCFGLKIYNTVKFPHLEDKTFFFLSKSKVWRNLSATEIHGPPYKEYVSLLLLFLQ